MNDITEEMPKIGGVYEGKITLITKNGVWFDIGCANKAYMSAGLIAAKKGCFIDDVRNLDEYQEGRSFKVKVINDKNKDGADLIQVVLFEPPNVAINKKSNKLEFSNFDKIEREEGQTVEFKSSIIYSPKTGKPGDDQLFTIAKECAAFMNADGGTLYLGVNDNGYVTGIENDYDVLDKATIRGIDHKTDKGFSHHKNWDGFQCKFTNLLQMMLSPDLSYVFDTKLEEGDKTKKKYVVVTIPKADRIIYCGKNKDVYVRTNSKVTLYNGTNLELWMEKRKESFKGYSQSSRLSKVQNKTDYKEEGLNLSSVEAGLPQDLVVDKDMTTISEKNSEVVTTESELQETKLPLKVIGDEIREEDVLLTDDALGLLSETKQQIGISEKRVRMISAVVAASMSKEEWLTCRRIEDLWKSVSGITIRKFLGCTMRELCDRPLGRKWFDCEFPRSPSERLKIQPKAVRETISKRRISIRRYVEGCNFEDIDFENVAKLMKVNLATVYLKYLEFCKEGGIEK